VAMGVFGRIGESLGAPKQQIAGGFADLCVRRSEREGAPGTVEHTLEGLEEILISADVAWPPTDRVVARRA